MLLQLSVENFKSIKKPIVLSMVAAKDDTHLSYLHNINNYQILPSSLIIGTNGAGKSNLFRAIKYLQALLKAGNHDLLVYPHLLSGDKSPTKIDIQFLVNEKRIAYGFDVLKNQVVGEYLYVIDDEDEMVFDREGENYEFGSVYQEEFNNLAKEYGSLKKLFLPILTEYCDNHLFKDIYRFLTENIYVILSDSLDDTAYFQEALEQYREVGNPERINELMKSIDIGINEFALIGNDIIVKYRNMEINILDESTGMKKLFTLLVLLSDALKDGKVILFDELERNLHHAFVLYFIHLFNDPKINTNNAQLIFSAHQTQLLDLTIFRKDQIWFMDKDIKTMMTECYSLYNIENVNISENVEKGYLLGKYGATFAFNHGGVKKDEK